MTENQDLEFNILGCLVRAKPASEDHIDAASSVNLVIKEIDDLRQKNPNLKDVELAVLTSLKFATQTLEIDAEFKENIFALKSQVDDVLKVVEKGIKEESARL